MPSNSAKGAYYKARSKKVLESAGYNVADMEIVRQVWTPRGMIATKRDQFGADLLAKNINETLYVQVKSTIRRADIASAKRAFEDAGPWPPSTRREIHVWKRGARAPEIVQCP